MSTRIGTVYFVGAAEVDAVKIGFTYSPEDRLKKMLYWSPCELKILATAPGRIRDEREIHHAFKADRMHHEWFRHTKELAWLIDEVAATGALPERVAI